MTQGHKLTAKQWISRASFCFGNVGHSAFYGVMSTYFIIFVTGGMFNGLKTSVADKLIGLITGLIVTVRILELVIDPLLGNIVDNTKTRWGKFKPWIMIGNIVSVALLLILFTGIFGLAKVNWVLFAILFVIIFILFDIFYSFSDVSYWGMVPALSEDSEERADDHRGSGGHLLHLPGHGPAQGRSDWLVCLCGNRLHHRSAECAGSLPGYQGKAQHHSEFRSGQDNYPGSLLGHFPQ